MATEIVRKVVWRCDFCNVQTFTENIGETLRPPDGWDKVKGPDTGWREPIYTLYDRCETCKADRAKYSQKAKNNRLARFENY